VGSIYFVRHAQASFGTDIYDRLSPLGHEQAQLAGEYFARLRVGIVQVLCGSLKRQQDTAAEIARRLRTPAGQELEVQSDIRLDELDFDRQFERIVPLLDDSDGELKVLRSQANSSSRSYQKLLKRVFQHWQEAQERAPELETWEEFSARTTEVLHDAVRTTGPGASTVIVTSGAVIAAITQQVLGLPRSGVYPLFESMLNCSVTHLLYDRQRVSLSSFNDCSYLTAFHPANEGRSLLTYR
jgi:broad specificity phosphatase PhoE